MKIKYILSLTVLLFLGGLFTVVHSTYAAATLYFASSSTNVYVGNTIIIYPKVNTGGDATNAYSANIYFPADLLEPVSITKGGSICTLFTQEPSITSNSASISCGLPSPGYNGTSGTLGTVTFRAKAVGSATISMLSTSQVLANDGQGTNILGLTSSITINISEPPPPPIGSPTVKCSPGSDNEWINKDNVTCTWSIPSGTKGFSYQLSTNQNTQAGTTNMGMDTEKSFKNLSEGIYYFIIAATDGSKWSTKTIYTIKIDITPPKDLEIVSDPSNDTPIKKLPMISFNAVDTLSGIEHYEIKIDDGNFIKTSSPYKFKEISSGEHTITVKAVDQAGNTREDSISISVIEIQPPIISTPKNNAYIPLAEKLFVDGTSEPLSKVYMYLNGEHIATVSADENGYFSYKHDEFLMPGTYTVSARVKSEGGLMSKNSEEVHFKIDAYAFNVFGVTVPSICFVPALVILFVFLIISAIGLYKRYYDFKERVHKKVSKVRKTVDNEFEELDTDVNSNIESVLKKKVKRRRAEIELKIRKGMKQEMNEAESDIEHSLDNILKAEKSEKKKIDIHDIKERIEKVLEMIKGKKEK